MPELQQAGTEAEAGTQTGWAPSLVPSIHRAFSGMLKGMRLDPLELHIADQMLQVGTQPSELRIMWVPFRNSKQVLVWGDGS